MTSRDQPLVRRERAPVLFVWPAPPVDRPPPPLTWRDAMLHVDIGLGTFGPSPEGAIAEEYKARGAAGRAVLDTLRFVCGGYVDEAAGLRVEVFTLADMDRARVGDVVRLALEARP